MFAVCRTLMVNRQIPRIKFANSTIPVAVRELTTRERFQLEKMAARVYYDLMSQPCRALLIFLRCSKVPCKLEEIALRKRQHKSEDFLKINPHGKVPVIDDGGFVLTESVAILKYLSDKYNAPDNWYPKDLQLRARVDEYCAWQHMNTRYSCSMVFLNDVMQVGKLGDPKKLQSQMNRTLDQFENIFLKDKKFIAGNNISIADLLAVCEIMQPTIAGHKIFETRPVLQKYLERVKEATNPYFDEAHAFLYIFRDRFANKNKL